MDKMKRPHFSNVVFWLKNKWLRPESQSAYEASLAYEEMGAGDKHLQDIEKRFAIVRYAYEHCPFYKNYYDSLGFSPSCLQSEMDWNQVPILEKDMIRNGKEDFVSDEYSVSDLGVSTTGGSTGTPLKVYKSKHVHYEVLGWRALRWWGVSPADNEAILHRRVPTTFKERLINALMWWPTRRAFLSATAISESDIVRFLADVKKKRIHWMVGYCATLEHVADYVLRNHIDVQGIKLVWSTSSPLTDIVRRKIESAFHCQVMDQYGCCEMGHIAVQKPQEDFLTVNSDYVHVDIVDGTGKILTDEHGYGDVLITELKTKEFPLIKYRLGDKSRIVHTMEESSDGFPKMEFVKGRISDAIWLPDGTYVDGAFLTTICDNYSDFIDCYQIRQGKNYSVNVDFVLKEGAEGGSESVDSIVRDLRKLLSDKVALSVNIVRDIPDNAGKRKFIISDISLSKLS